MAGLGIAICAKIASRWWPCTSVHTSAAASLPLTISVDRRPAFAAPAGTYAPDRFFLYAIPSVDRPAISASLFVRRERRLAFQRSPSASPTIPPVRLSLARLFLSRARLRERHALVDYADPIGSRDPSTTALSVRGRLIRTGARTTRRDRAFPCLLRLWPLSARCVRSIRRRLRYHRPSAQYGASISHCRRRLLAAIVVSGPGLFPRSAETAARSGPNAPSRRPSVYDAAALNPLEKRQLPSTPVAALLVAVWGAGSFSLGAKPRPRDRAERQVTSIVFHGGPHGRAIGVVAPAQDLPASSSIRVSRCVHSALTFSRF